MSLLRDLEYFTLVASEMDLASVTMSDYLINGKGFDKDKNKPRIATSKIYRNIILYISDQHLLCLDNLDTTFPESKAFIFLSKHKSSSEIPTLTCHSTGNFSTETLGGNPMELGISYPSFQKQYLRKITSRKFLIPSYEIVIEATHHGPTSLKKPVLFVEIGSTERQWEDRTAASIVCDSLLEVISDGIRSSEKVGIGLGGLHYPMKFNKLLLESDFSLASIAAKHNLETIDFAMLKQMLLKTAEEVTHIIVDWKGLGKEKTRIMMMLEGIKLEILRL